MTLGLASTSVGGGFTGSKAENSLALGHKAGAYYRPKCNVQFNVGNVVGNGNQGFNGGLSFKVGAESKAVASSTDDRIAQLEKRIQELEQAKK